MKKRLKEALHELIRDLDKNENDDFARLNFHIFLLDTVESNLNAILEFHRTEGVDLKLPQFLNGDTHSIHLILSSEGCQLIESLAKMSAWPLWAVIVDLPTMKRAAFRNMTLCSLFFGSGKPDIQKAFDHFFNEIALGYTLQSTTRTYKVEFIPNLINADLIAKAKLLNMRQYNGYYGCSMCFMPGFHVRGAHVYPILNASK